MIENEFKLLISEADFTSIKSKVLHYYPEQHPIYIIQTNYYYDTIDFNLNKNGMTLRVISIGNENILQLKTVRKVVSQNKTSNEYHKSLKYIPNIINSNIIPNNLQSSFQLIGCLKTDRTSFIISDNIRIDLDKNSYLNKIDYEIEFEYDNEIPNELINYLTNELPIYKPIGKYERLLELLITK